MGSARVVHGDCLDVMRGMPDGSVHAVVTDPPYGLEFMGKDWDSFKAVPSGGSGFSADGMGKGFKALPSYTGSPNPSCLNCGGTQRGADGQGVKRCRCDAPRFPNVRRAQSAAYGAWCEEWAAECLRVLRPGGYLLAFGGTRTFHRLACAVEDGGFEIRDSIAWLYGSGFPKSLDVGKAIDKLNDKPLDRLREFGAHVRAARAAAGLTQAEVNRVMGMPQGCGWWEGKGLGAKWDLHPPSRDTWARLKTVVPTLGDEWDEFIEWAEAEREAIGQRRQRANGPESSVRLNSSVSAVEVITAPATAAAREWAGWGTALKPAFEPIVVARKPLAVGTVAGNVLAHGTGALNIDACRVATDDNLGGGGFNGSFLLHGCRSVDELRELAAVNATTPDGRSAVATYANYLRNAGSVPGSMNGRWPANVALDGSQADALGAEGRFFPTFRYQAKAPTAERPTYVTADGRKISHPTVKPVGLMRWLVRLVTPPGGTVLDPFAGSGATLEACLIEGFDCIAIERDAESLPLIQQRIDRQAGTLPFEDVS